jgi:Peptide methionine sulfoxide reductase
MTTERAVLAGSCFWGMQDLIRKLSGVISTRVGYTGGDVPNATYRNHGTHAEAIEMVFARIPQMDGAGRIEGPGNNGEIADSLFHPPRPSGLGYVIHRKGLI